MLGPEARKYAEKSGNPIGKISEDINKYYNGNKKINKITPWCTCIGSEVCSYYSNKFNDGTHIKFINNNDKTKYYTDISKSNCESTIKSKISYTSHNTPGINKNTKKKCNQNNYKIKNIKIQ
jgi:hypothetical protein